jgi:uncharacterized protein (DUF4415 family)
MSRKPDLIMPTDEEDAAINRGIAADPDNPELTDADFARMRPAEMAHPKLVEAYRRTRGPQKTPTKQPISIRFDRDVIERLKASGPGWQGRANDLLRKAVGL